ncbi:hypothetical protein GC722_02195 [Auraticoccus sp. F435]|uniref:Uncharacterized protein n=1 Tax=Auraticoccus cholistanensis TaxID=2656650 RepID=A0A6A9UUG5_9ACTN|nr:hypothetical protein [Auraticoccus cholistanensis]MVA74847.1 hypothetical protein [Auraticoccus cholistanensis]
MSESSTHVSGEQDDFASEVHEHVPTDREPTPRLGEQASASPGEALDSEREAVAEDFQDGGAAAGR